MRFRITPLLFLFALAVGVDFCIRITVSSNPPLVHPPTIEQYSQYLSSKQIGALQANLPLQITPKQSLNRFGMRMGDVDIKKAPDAIRIALMGDSITYGIGVPLEKTFAAQLEPLLNQDAGQNIEVLNFGAPGFSSFQGLKQYEWLVHNFKPDVLVLAFGLYDGFEARVSDAEWYSLFEQAGVGKELTGLKKLLDRCSAFFHWRNTRKYAAAFETAQSLYESRLQSIEWTERVSVDDMISNLSAIIQHHQKQGGTAVIANLNLLNYRTEKPLQTLAQNTGAAYMEARSMFDNVGGRGERELAPRLYLKPAERVEAEFDQTPHITFRLYGNARELRSDGFSIIGEPDWLGGGAPNRTRLYDDGTHGDEHANDSVWTLEVEAIGDRPIDYAFTPNYGKGIWSDKQEDALHDARNLAFYYRLPVVPWAKAIDERTVVHQYGAAPFEEFLLPGTEALPNAQGHAAIARRLASVIQQHALPTQNIISQNP
ncbi:SGNH/GDSL hydrolase family protein [bacterium]|nr:SGNH/GDSL hydrolase family protein [bacterium]